MNFLNKNKRKLQRGSISIGIVAVVIAAVILLNVGLTALFSSNLIFMDMSPESYYTASDNKTEKTTTLYSLMDETIEYLDTAFSLINASRKSGDPVQIDIIFCADPDILVSSDRMRYVYYTALALEQEYPDYIHVKTTNVWVNPSSVDAYRTNSYSQIYQNNVIIASGSEYRITTEKTFYVYSEYGSSIPWAYHGEKVFVSNILSVTQSESPICCFTTNHAEPILEERYSEFRKLVESVGFEIQYLDLETQEIPEDCRMIITLAPTEDFKTDYINSESVNEIKKLEEYLDKTYSYMVFADVNTPELPVFEAFLEEWGISFMRYENEDGIVEGNYMIADAKDSLDANADGTNLIGQYETNAPSAVWMEDMRNFGANPKVVFSDAIGIRYSYTEHYQPADDEYSVEPYLYGSYSSNGRYRLIYDLFRTGDSATAYAVDQNGNKIVKDGDVVVDSASPFRLMTITSEEKSEAEGVGYTVARNATYVCAIGSTRIVSNEMLQSDTYGNTDAILSVLREMSKEVEPVGLNFKILHQDAIDEELYATVPVTAWTVSLIMIPLLLCAGAGVFVLVRRKTKH